jgi:hypothetical protein
MYGSLVVLIILLSTTSCKASHPFSIHQWPTSSMRRHGLGPRSPSCTENASFRRFLSQLRRFRPYLAH